MLARIIGMSAGEVIALAEDDLAVSQASYTLAAHDRDIQSEYEGHEEMP